MTRITKDATLRCLSRMAAVAVTAGALALAALAPTPAAAIPADITYQAQLVGSSGSPITSSDVTVTIAIFPDAVAVSALKTVTFANLDLSATAGWVNLDVDMTGVDLSGDLYVEVTVDDNTDVAAAETLSPRQRITSVPFALSANSVDGKTFSDIQGYTSDALANINRTIIVNPDTTQSATPTGLLDDPFDNIADAYAHAKTLPGAGSYFNRIIVLLMPGEHYVNTTVELDTVGIDIIGFGEKNAFVRGTADPLFLMTADTSGAWIRNVQLRLDSGTTNRAVKAEMGGRLENVTISRSGTQTVAPLLLDVGSTVTLSVRNFEIYGDVQIDSYGQQTSFTDGFITGTVTSTGNSPTAAELLAFLNMSAIGGVNFQPASGVGILGFSNVTTVAGMTYSGTTVLRAGNTAFVNPATFAALNLSTNPLSGSQLINCIANPSGWTGTISSSGNVTGAYVAFTAK